MHECTIPNCSSDPLNTCHRPQVPFFSLSPPTGPLQHARLLDLSVAVCSLQFPGEYTLPPSVDSRASTSTRDSDSTDISSASVASPSTVPVQDNSAFNRSAANPYSYLMTQIASTSQSNTPTSVQPSSSSAPVPAAHSIQSYPQPAMPSGSTSTSSSVGVSTSSTVQGPNLLPRK
ncbi:hypothetical protein B0H13DRAFT_2112152 [Mycena leptocephala]|nr:hypothetical protein B0H13DRAFT_2112152 [Mycena leptocephala]